MPYLWDFAHYPLPLFEKWPLFKQLSNEIDIRINRGDFYNNGIILSWAVVICVWLKETLDRLIDLR